MEYQGKIRNVRVRIIATAGPWKEHIGQECDATLYAPGIMAHINTEQLTPPAPKWQSAHEHDLLILCDGWGK